MNGSNLGRLERLDLRKTWPSEASDFTPWLARKKNLAVLAESSAHCIASLCVVFQTLTGMSRTRQTVKLTNKPRDLKLDTITICGSSAQRNVAECLHQGTL
jgi:hypothetical protein